MVVKAAVSPILGLIRRAVEDPSLREQSDQELLQRFGVQQDQAAFHALLRRHGPMVLDVCRGALSNEADAEDAFQATFLVLARKAGSIRKSASLGSWLHGVAYRTALKARAQSATRDKHEARVCARQAAEPGDLSWREMRQVLHEELSGLPERYRAPLVLCYLEGATQEAAAGQLNLAKSTLRERLERGRTLLRNRLMRRGLGPAAVLVAAAWPAASASACVSNSVVSSTIQAASLFAAGQAAAANVISAKVAALTEGVLKTMLFTKLKKAIALIALLGLVACGGRLLTQQPAIAQPGPFAKTSEVFQKEARTQTDLQKLQGTWTLVEAHQHGKKVAASDLPTKDLAWKSHELTVAGEKIAIRYLGGGRDAYGKFKLDTTKKPKEIRIAWSIIAWFCIYKVDDDTLTICMNENTNLPLPDEFRTQADSDRLLFVYRRTKSDQDKKGQGDDKRPNLSGTQLRLVPEAKAPDQTDPSTPEVRIFKGHSGGVYFTFFSPDGARLVTGAKGINFKNLEAPRRDEVIIWDVAAQRAKHKIQFTDSVNVWSLTLSADGKTLAVGTNIGIELRDAETGNVRRTLHGPWPLSTGPCSLAFAPDSKTLAAGGSARDHIVRLWNVQSGELTGTLKGHSDEVAGLSFSSDGKTLVSTGGMNDTTVRFWEAATGKLRLTVNKANEESKDGTEAVDGNWQSWPMAFSPDGKILARGRGSEVKVWDAWTGEVRDRVIGGAPPANRLVQSLAFSSDGKLLAGGRDSGEIDIWETRPADGKHDWRIGDLRETLKKHSHPVMALAFSSSGEFLASGDQDGKVRVWNMTKK